MPLLQSWEEPEFNTIGEVVDFFYQAFEGLQYMHTNGVAFSESILGASPPLPSNRARDFQSTPSHTTRTLAPVKYYFIDLGVAKKYDLSEVTTEIIQYLKIGVTWQNIPTS